MLLLATPSRAAQYRGCGILLICYISGNNLFNKIFMTGASSSFEDSLKAMCIPAEELIVSVVMFVDQSPTA